MPLGPFRLRRHCNATVHTIFTMYTPCLLFIAVSMLKESEKESERERSEREREGVGQREREGVSERERVGERERAQERERRDRGRAPLCLS